jgi:glycerol-3-phosphate dehydrogenase
MGRCQGGFCSPTVLELLAREMGVAQESITKCGGGSVILTGLTKTGQGGEES